jgi:hypothetical protein
MTLLKKNPRIKSYAWNCGIRASVPAVAGEAELREDYNEGLHRL